MIAVEMRYKNVGYSGSVLSCDRNSIKRVWTAVYKKSAVYQHSRRTPRVFVKAGFEFSLKSGRKITSAGA
jgi:hypothetical protein